MTITKQQFQAYEEVRQSGVTNMYDTRLVGNLSGLSRDQILEVMKHYGELADRYLEKRKHG